MNKENILIERDNVISTIPNLIFRAESLSTEGMGVYVNEVSEYFTNKIKDIANIFSTSKKRTEVVSKKELTEQAKDLIKLRGTVNDIIKNTEMKNVANVETPVILGMSVNMLVATELILSISKYSTSDILENLDDLDTLISNMLSSKDARSKSTPYTNYDSDIYKNNEHLENVIAKIINKNGTIDRKPVIEVTPNIKSIQTIYDNLRKMNTMFDYTTMSKIKEDVSKLSSKVELLEEVLSDKNIGNVSKSALNELAYNLEIMAHYVTNAITIFYIVNQLNDMFGSLCKVINIKNS